jgi:hypothetical protein
VLDATVRKQLEVKTNRTSFYAEIVTDITTQNSEHTTNVKGQHTKKEEHGPHKKTGVSSGAREG